jgi:hypothetical protein
MTSKNQSAPETQTGKIAQPEPEMQKVLVNRKVHEIPLRRDETKTLPQGMTKITDWASDPYKALR